MLSLEILVATVLIHGIVASVSYNTYVRLTLYLTKRNNIQKISSPAIHFFSQFHLKELTS